MQTGIVERLVAPTGTERVTLDEEIRQDDGTGVDRLAIGLSLLCLVHCLALPVAVLAAPTLGALMLGTESPLHWVLLALALPISGYALWHGFRHHGRWNALMFGIGGLAVMALGVSHVTARALEAPLTVAGVLLLLVAHLLNLRYHARCSHPA